MLTVPELHDIMLAAGADDAAVLDLDNLDVPFDDLGYDSLARMHIVGQVQALHRVVVGDDELAGGMTPAQLVARVNAAAAQPVTVA